MNGDGRDDLLCTWKRQGVYYRVSGNGNWVRLATPADQVAAGDLDGDGVDDLLGIWPRQGGVWVKYGKDSNWDSNWELLSSTADWIGAGKMRSGSEISGDMEIF